MKVLIIRHGRTQGNTERRYVGARTDESLSEEGRAELKTFDSVEQLTGEAGGSAGKTLIVSSPMKRAVETAGIMFPDAMRTGLADAASEENEKPDMIVIDELRETDFGIFEGRTYEELSSDPKRRDQYQAWVDSGGIGRIPGGESMEEARERSIGGFRKAVRAAYEEGAETLIIIAHGGTVMSVMSSLFGGDYYDYYAGNGEGYIFRLEVDDAGDYTAAGTYDSFCGRIRA